MQQPQPSHRQHQPVADEVNAVVIDLGGSLCRAGYSGDDTPKSVLPSVSAQRRRDRSNGIRVARGIEGCACSWCRWVPFDQQAAGQCTSSRAAASLGRRSCAPPPPPHTHTHTHTSLPSPTTSQYAGVVPGSDANGTASGGSDGGRSVFIGSEALSFKRDGMQVLWRPGQQPPRCVSQAAALAGCCCCRFGGAAVQVSTLPYVAHHHSAPPQTLTPHTQIMSPFGSDDLIEDWDLAAKLFSYSLK